MKERMKVLKVFSTHGLASAESRAAVLSYLEHSMPGCRYAQGKHGSDERHEVAVVHLHMVHAVRAVQRKACCCSDVHRHLCQGWQRYLVSHLL